MPLPPAPRRARARGLPPRQAERDARPRVPVPVVQPRSSVQLASRQLSLEELSLTLPPLFAEACGYRGNSRYVALCWIPELGELWWSDDGEAVLGVAGPFLLLCRHRATAGALSGYLAAATVRERERPWLLVDRGRRNLSI